MKERSLRNVTAPSCNMAGGTRVSHAYAESHQGNHPIAALVNQYVQ